MTKMTYAEQLKHPNWQRKRLVMLDAAKWTCQDCGATEKTLHVHHKQYVRGRMAWDYEQNELQVLCEECHESEHKSQDDIEYLLKAEWLDKELNGKEIVLGFLAGFLCPFAGNDQRLRDISDRAVKRQMPFFDLGFMVAALGPDELSAAVRRKIDDGRMPDHPFLRAVMGEEAGD